MLLNQGDIVGTIVWFLVFFIFIVLYPRLMLSQLIWKIEAGARRIEAMSERANAMAARKVGERSAKKTIDQFTEFFVIEPSALDPFGLVKKVDQIIRQTESRFDDFVRTIGGKLPQKAQQELNYGLRAAISLRQIAKAVRHFVEMSKKYKNLQIAMVVQMQLPLIEKLAEGELKGTQAFLNGWAVGDSIGPLVAAELTERMKPIAEDVVAGRAMIDGRRCFVLKATGPAPHLGRIDEAIEKIMSRHDIARIITIDAAQKLEGEPTGSVAEGVGFAMGGVSQREIIENVLLPKKKPIDSVVIKIGTEDAIAPMKKEIVDSVPKALEMVRAAVRRARRGANVLIIGVGNSCGIPDERKELPRVKAAIRTLAEKIEKSEAAQKKGGWL
ncbi:MAG: DUF1512 family protein [Candidatus Aenigmatarchaeota archaeon]